MYCHGCLAALPSPSDRDTTGVFCRDCQDRARRAD